MLRGSQAPYCTPIADYSQILLIKTHDASIRRDTIHAVLVIYLTGTRRIYTLLLTCSNGTMIPGESLIQSCCLHHMSWSHSSAGLIASWSLTKSFNLENAGENIIVYLIDRW